jgi:hypothetical protein
MMYLFITGNTLSGVYWSQQKKREEGKCPPLENNENNSRATLTGRQYSLTALYQ